LKTDPLIHEYLATGPEAFRVLTGGLTLSGEYVFRALTLKGIERRLDGIYEPQSHAGPAYVIEFQAQPAAGAWYNLLTKLGLYGEARPERDARGLLILLRARDEPGCPRGAGQARPLLTAVGLDRVLPEWLAREPDNPYVAALAPLIVADDAELLERAPVLWRAIQDAPVAPPVRATLERVLEFWLFERFQTLTAEEIWTMLNVLIPIEETRAYQSIFTKGEAKGKAEGEAKGKAEGKAEGEVEGKADGLKRLLTRRFGPLPAWAADRIDVAAIDQLNAWLEGIFDARSVEDLIGPKSRQGKKVRQREQTSPGPT
jgi:hypothetical protein